MPGSFEVICPCLYLEDDQPCSRPSKSTNNARTDSVPKSRPNTKASLSGKTLYLQYLVESSIVT